MKSTTKTVMIINTLMLSFVILTGFVSADDQYNTDLFKGLKARSIGPAGMSGRIADIAVVHSNPDIMYVGSATGGLWKSVNMGITWNPIFDKQPVSSIGAVSVFQKNPSIVWVGTGEGNPRNSVGVGNGAFKSMDGGRTWECIGLKNTEKIHRIILHPDNPDIAYAGALGTTWGENPERGVYKTTDGGNTWKKILFVDKKTGCADLVMDPSNPNKLFAAMWQHRRWPWFFKSGGPGSGLYVTNDGGEHWKKISSEQGIPEGDLGRIGIAIARNNPQVVYALIEAEKNCLCRSEDGGESWKIVNKESGVNSRPFYYADIRVDPESENRIYSLQSRLKVSEDGGKSFESVRSRIHSDHHALWIHPEDGSFMIDGNDGGVAISYDRGQSWRFIPNIPVAQFYHISVDNQLPYNIYGGMQDNGSWRGPGYLWEEGGIRNYHWIEVGFGDGFATLNDPENPQKGYSMSQQGYLMRFDIETGERKDIRPPSPADSVELRFNWNAAIALDPFDPSIVYYGSQFVHKSTDKGQSWTVLSPDLTTDDPSKQKQQESGGLTYDVTGAENHTTIITISPSSIKKGVIWVGTDDGNVQVTRDNGKTWKNVVRHVPDLPLHTWCPHIEPSKFDAATAYAVFDDHRRSNWETYVYKTEDYGRHWKNLAKNDPVQDKKNEVWGFAHVIRQDPVNPELLYLGTEFGLYVSFDDGEHWMKWMQGVPTVPVRDMVIHPREHDLIIGTHGRAAFVIDNIRPLRGISQQLLNKTLHIFNIPDAYLHENRQAKGYHFPADAIFQGENRPYGAMITYYLNPGFIRENNRKDNEKKKEEMKVKIRVYDLDSTLVRDLDGPASKGINRIYWDLRREGFKRPSLSEEQRDRDGYGPEIVPGEYIVNIAFKGQEVFQNVNVLPDPRVDISMDEYKEKYTMIVEVGKKVEFIADVIDRIKEANKTIDLIITKSKEQEDSLSEKLIEDAENLKKEIKSVTKIFIPIPGEKQGITGGDYVMRDLWYVSRSLSSSYDKPTDSQIQYYQRAEKHLQEALDRYNTLFDEKVRLFYQEVKKSGFSFFPEIKIFSLSEE